MNQKELVWIRSGARCAICNRYLLDDDLGDVVPIGENAHIVGREQTAGSPRGLEPLPLADRDKAENLVLLCREQHRLIDRAVAVFSVDELTKLKQAHEQRIRQVTEIGARQRTTILRALGKVRGSTVSVNRGLVASAVIRSQRYPHYSLAHNNDGVEINLQDIPDEGSAAYYQTACAFIDPVLTRLVDGLSREEVRHVSVFGFVRLPLLVYLGWRLDDTFEVDIYQRHRSTQDWTWDDGAPEHTFDVVGPETPPSGEEAILILNLSGTIQPHELPAEIAELPRYLCAPHRATPHPDLFANRGTLANFERTLRGLFATIEETSKGLRRIHLLGAMPISPAITVGRVLGPCAPRLAVYDEEGGIRRIALEVGPQ